MINIHASAVCRVRDGYTQRALEPTSLTCALDGVPCRPVGKPGGYLVLVNLPHGPHRLSLRGSGYQEEWVDFTAGTGTQELNITMKPDREHPLYRRAVYLELTVQEGGGPAAGKTLWLAAPDQPELKIAQAQAEAGSGELRLYRKGPEIMSLPGTYLIADGPDSEIVTLQSLEAERGPLAALLARSHGRGRLLLPAQSYHTGADGAITAAFRQGCTVEVYSEGRGLLASLELAAEGSRHTIRI